MLKTFEVSNLSSFYWTDLINYKLAKDSWQNYEIIITINIIIIIFIIFINYYSVSNYYYFLSKSISISMSLLSSEQSFNISRKGAPIENISMERLKT